MLILSRRPGESMTFCEANLLHAKSPLRKLDINLHEDIIQVHVLSAKDGNVMLGIKAPDGVEIRRTTPSLPELERKPRR